MKKLDIANELGIDLESVDLVDGFLILIDGSRLIATINFRTGKTINMVAHYKCEHKGLLKASKALEKLGAYTLVEQV